MAIRKKTSTTRLPQSILQELGESSGNSNSRSSVAGGRSRSHVPRKDARKQEREARKQKKAAYFSVNNKKRLAEEEHHESPQRKKPRQASSAEPRVAAFSSETPSTKGKESLVAHKPAAPAIKTKKTHQVQGHTCCRTEFSPSGNESGRRRGRRVYFLSGIAVGVFKKRQKEKDCG